MNDFSPRAAAAAHKGLQIALRGGGEEAGELMAAALGHRARKSEEAGFFGPAYKSAFRDYVRKGQRSIKGDALKTLQEGEDTAGGFLIPPTLLQEVARRLPSAGVVPFLSQHTTINFTDTAILPLFTGSDDGFPTAMRFALTGGWSNLQSPSTSDVRTEPLIGSSRVALYTWLASVVLSRNLLEDSGIADFDAVIAALALQTQQAHIENMVLAGAGGGQPAGVLARVSSTGDTTGVVQSVKSGSASTLTADGIADLFGALPAQYLPRARWIMNPTTMLAILLLKDDQHRPLLTFEGDSGYIYGRPVIQSAFMPTVAAGAFPIVFGDLAGAHWVTGRPLSVSMHDEAVAEQNLVVLKIRFRAGGTVAEPYRFRVQVVSS